MHVYMATVPEPHTWLLLGTSVLSCSDMVVDDASKRGYDASASAAFVDLLGASR